MQKILNWIFGSVSFGSLLKSDELSSLCISNFPIFFKNIDQSWEISKLEALIPRKHVSKNVKTLGNVDRRIRMLEEPYITYISRYLRPIFRPSTLILSLKTWKVALKAFMIPRAWIWSPRITCILLKILIIYFFMQYKVR